MKRIKSTFVAVLLCLAVVLPVLMPARAALAARIHPPMKSVRVTVACGFTQIPFGVYSMPITQTETLALTFQSSGSGLVTFTANNYQTFYWQRTDANCGTCTLTLPNVQVGPHGIVQLAADVAADACPSGGINASNFQLVVMPAHPVSP